jgi:hypothetical protein
VHELTGFKVHGVHALSDHISHNMILVKCVENATCCFLPQNRRDNPIIALQPKPVCISVKGLFLFTVRGIRGLTSFAVYCI